MGVRSRRTRGEELLVDGYNLIHAAPALWSGRTASLQAARRALEAALQGFARRTAARVLVFYDGDRAAGSAPASARGRVEVFFSSPPQSADDLLKHAIERRHGARGVRVITSDREIRHHARRHRLAATTAADFAAEIEQPATAGPALPLQPPVEFDPDLSLSPAEVEAWEELFRKGPDAGLGSSGHP